MWNSAGPDVQCPQTPNNVRAHFISNCRVHKQTKINRFQHSKTHVIRSEKNWNIHNELHHIQENPKSGLGNIDEK